MPQWVQAWDALYSGRLIADDIEGLVLQLERETSAGNEPIGPFDLKAQDTGDIGDLLGNHQDPGRALPDELKDALEEAMKEMNGSGIWREPGSRGVGAHPYEALFTGKDEPMLRWERKTIAVLKQYLQPDVNSRAFKEVPVDYRLPVYPASFLGIQ